MAALTVLPILIRELEKMGSPSLAACLNAGLGITGAGKRD